MHLRKFLILVPAIVLLLLLQAAMWVPRYGQSQHPTRLETFIEASSGDARTLNPVLHADTSSGRIVDLVFDGLLKIGDDLKLHGALAQSWTLREDTYLLIEPASLHGEHPGTRIIQRLKAGLAQPQYQALATQISAISLSPATADLPARIKFSLTQVQPDLLRNVLDILGKRYGQGIQQPDVFTQGKRLPLLEHNPIIEFKLRTDVKFHDGIGFDARDVMFSYQAIMSARNRSPLRSNFEPIKDIRMIGPYQIEVVYKRLFSSAVNAWTVGILPRGLHNGADYASLRDNNFNRHPIGTGAFEFVRWQSSEFIELKRNPVYWDGPPLYSKYFYRIIPDKLTQELEFRSGAVDTFQVEPHQAKRYRANPKYQTFSALSHGYTYIGYNLRKPLFAAPQLRRALGMAIDTQAIIRYVLFGEGQRITGPFPRLSPWYDSSISALPYDPQAALKLLTQMGWHKNAQGWLERDGTILEFNLITNNGNLRRKAIASIVQRYWQRIGVKSHVQLFEWSVFLKDFINPGKFDAVVLGWQLELDPDQYQIWHSSQTGPNQLNFIGFKNARIDQLIEDIRKEYATDKQISLTHELHKIIAQQQPYTFLFAPQETRILDRQILMRDLKAKLVPIRAGGAGNLFYYLNRWQKIAHNPGG